MLANVINTFANCFKIPELKSRIIFTLLVLGVCRLIANIPAPGLDPKPLLDAMEEMRTRSGAGGLMMMYNLFTGGALQNCSVGALGIMPYITASIIMQMLSAMVPQLSKLAREEGGRTKIIQYSRYLTVMLCLVHGTVMALSWENPSSLFQGIPEDVQLVVYGGPLWWFRIQTVILLTTGTMVLMWMGEQITDRGIGNGVSLIITIGILAELPSAARGIRDMFATGGNANLFHAIAMILLLLSVIAGVIAVTQAQRKIPVQYAQKAVGRKVYAGGSSFMPLRVNYAGVMPVIFAQAILMFPAQIFSFLANHIHVKALQEMFGWLAFHLNYGQGAYLVVFGMMILFFSYFWVATQFNEIQIADDLKKHGGYIPGVRPGQATSQFLGSAMKRITLAGAIFLTVIAVIPILLATQMEISMSAAQFFGGTSLLILVGVLLDTMRQMESHLLMRHYDGFLKKGRIRGRF